MNGIHRRRRNVNICRCVAPDLCPSRGSYTRRCPLAPAVPDDATKRVGREAFHLGLGYAASPRKEA
jgi:hypothetical protein